MERDIKMKKFAGLLFLVLIFLLMAPGFTFAQETPSPSPTPSPEWTQQPEPVETPSPESVTPAPGEDFVNFEGIGIVVERDLAGSILISGIFKGSPAENYLQVGDRILEVYGESTRYLTTNDVMQRIEKPLGIPVKITISRDGKSYPYEIKSAKFPVTPDTIPLNPEVPNGKILGFQSRDFMDAEFQLESGLRKGDTFFIFEGSSLLGLARISVLSGRKASLKVVWKNKDINAYRAYKYKLIYYCYLSEARNIDPTNAGQADIGDNGLLRVRMDKCDLSVISDGKVRAIITLSNFGSVTAVRVSVKCNLVSKKGKVYSEEFGYVNNLRPKAENILEVISEVSIPGALLRRDENTIYLKLPDNPEQEELSMEMEVKAFSEDGDIYVFKEIY